jgi:predicted Zn-dependent protease
LRKVRFFSLVAQVLLFLVAAQGLGADFTQADLEKMVKELETIAPKSDKYLYPIKAVIEKNDDVNACATFDKPVGDAKPQALMIVNTGLIDFVKGDARIIRSVVAHEVAHLANSHVKTTTLIARDLENLWTRQEEMEADIHGAQYLQRLGYSKQDMIEMLLMLEKLRGRQGVWLRRVTGDHPDPKMRAQQISDNPEVLRALVTFDTGLAYLDSRKYKMAIDLFDASLKQEPKLKEAYLNAGLAALAFYYDMTSEELKQTWFRPDFGPTLTEVAITARAAGLINDADRRRHTDAMTRLAKAKAEYPTARTNELYALGQILNPEADTTAINAGIQTLKGLQANATEADNLRLANNIAVGYHRLNNLQAAYDAIIEVQKKTKLFIPALGENLGLIRVTGAAKETEELMADILFTWLGRTPKSNSRWTTVKTTYDEILKRNNWKATDIPDKGVFLCRVVSINIDSNELGILIPVEDYTGALGAAEKTISFDSRYPDLTEKRWKGGDVSAYTERGKVMRVTSYAVGDYMTLHPLDKSLSYTLKISVGMTEDDLKKIINLDGGAPIKLARGGKGEDWLYFPSLHFGLYMKDGKVAGITATRTADD